MTKNIIWRIWWRKGRTWVKTNYWAESKRSALKNQERLHRSHPTHEYRIEQEDTP